MSTEFKHDKSQRKQARTATMAAVELQLEEDRGDGGLQSLRTHAIVTDASVGGLRVELFGVGARAFEQGNYRQARVTITFLQPQLVGLKPMLCSLRWARPSAKGYSLGLQLTVASLPVESDLMRALSQSVSSPRRLEIGAGIAFVLLACLLAAATAFWHLDRERDTMREQLWQTERALKSSTNINEQLARQAKDAELSAQRSRAELSLLHVQQAKSRQGEQMAAGDDVSAATVDNSQH